MCEFLNSPSLSAVEIEKLTALHNELDLVSHQGTITIAYSGGLDSRFLAFCARNFGYSVRLLHIAGVHISRFDTQEAVTLAKEMGLVCEVVHPVLPSPEELADAKGMRCYVCKKAIFTQLQALVLPARLCDGTNASDAGVFRPGSSALRELHIASPLAAAEISKDDIRAIGRATGFAFPEQAARPCLLTRFPYGVTPDAEKLSVIAEVEHSLAIDAQTRDLRFRLRYPDGVTPELHILQASLQGKNEAFPKELEWRLKNTYEKKLAHLRVRVVEKLSGYYDRLKNASGK